MSDRVHKTRFDVTATDQATPVFKTVEGGLESLHGKYLKVTAAAAAVFAAGGAAAFVLDAAHYRAALQDIADTTGDQVRTLDGMAKQARASGVEIETLGTTLAKFARNLNATDDEGTAAAQAIKAIGLNVDQLRALKPAEAFFEVAKALGGFEDGASKVAVAVALMGKEGARNLPFMKDLAENGQLQGKITAEQAKQAKELEQEWRRLGIAFQESKDGLADVLIPVLADFSEELAKAIRLSGGFFGALKLFARDIGRGFATPYEQVQQLNKEIEKLEKTRDAFEKRGDTGLARSVGETIDSKKTYRAYLNFLNDQELRKQYREMGITGSDIHAQPKRLDFVPGKPGAGDAAARDYENALVTLQKKIAGARTGDNLYSEVSAELSAGKYADRSEGERQALKNLAAQYEQERDLRDFRKGAAEEQTESAKNVAEAQNREIKRLAELRDKYLDLLDPLRKFSKEWEDLDTLLAEGLLTPEQYLDAYVKVAEAADKARLEIEGMGDASKDTKNAFAQMGFTATSALEDIIFKGGRAGDVIRALGQDLAKMFLRRKFFDPLAAGADKLFDGFFKTPEKASPGDFSAGGGFEGVDWDSLPAFAGGGSFKVGGRGATDSQLVAFRATPGERVDVRASGQSRGGGIVISHGDIIIQGEGVTMAQVRGALRAQQRQTLGAVRDERRR